MRPRFLYALLYTFITFQSSRSARFLTTFENPAHLRAPRTSRKLVETASQSFLSDVAWLVVSGPIFRRPPVTTSVPESTSAMTSGWGTALQERHNVWLNIDVPSAVRGGNTSRSYCSCAVHLRRRHAYCAKASSSSSGDEGLAP